MTQCINPSEIEEGDLLAYSEGAATKSVKDHLERCSHCAATARRYRRINQRLLSELYRSACPPVETLGRWQLRLLSPAEALQVGAHLRMCPHCNRELALLLGLDNDLLTALKAKLGDLWGYLEATLVAADPQAVRGAPSRQKRYQVDALNVFVGAQQSASRRSLIGRLRPLPEQSAHLAGVFILLVRDRKIIASRAADESGHFIFSDIEPGVYNLVFKWQGQAIIIKDVEV